MARAVADSGPFLFHLTGVLALVLLALALGRLLRRRELFPAPAAARLAVSTIGVAFCAVATLVMLIGQVPRGLVLPLEGSFGFLSLLVAGAFCARACRRAVKIGVALFALPGIFHVTSTVLERLGWTRGRSSIGDLVPLGRGQSDPRGGDGPLHAGPAALRRFGRQRQRDRARARGRAHRDIRRRAGDAL